MMFYKISYVVIGRQHPGAIMNAHKCPRIGDLVWINDSWFEIIEVREVMPPRSGVAFLHATVQPAEKPSAATSGAR